MNYSTNEEAERIVGKRKLPKNSIIFDQPYELNYHCPVCKYKNIVNGNYDQRLEWSEYNGFIWCSVCNKDYPTLRYRRYRSTDFQFAMLKLG